MLSDLETLRNLGSPEEFELRADRGEGFPVSWEANAHIHLPPNFSAFDSVAQAVSMSSAQHVRVLGVSNYYNFDVYSEFAAAARTKGVFPLFGLEVIAILEDLRQAGILINDPGNPGRMYLCGKGIVRFGPVSGPAGECLLEMRRNDSSRMGRMIELLNGIFGARGLDIGLGEETIIGTVARRHNVQRDQVCLQERHVARAFQEALFRLIPPEERAERIGLLLGTPLRSSAEDAPGVQGEIRSHLMKTGKPAFVGEKFVSFDQAYRLVLELGGIPCYPTLADGTLPVCPYEDPPSHLVRVLQKNRIHSAEFIPIRNEPAVLEHYVRTLRDAGIVITAGTEHNTPELIDLEPRCRRGAPVPESLKPIFREGACVVAAHQFLSLHGRCGYVDGRGELNPAFGDGESRIAYFRKLGAAVVAGYHEQFTE